MPEEQSPFIYDTIDEPPDFNTLLWLLLPGPFVLRRFLRLRRGLCPRCAYPMGMTDTCTECGATLPTRARPAT